DHDEILKALLFFQAEDGIRDFHVTGVQTCALPICLQDEKRTSNEMIDRLKDLSVISSSQAESINKSLESISSKDAYIRDLQSAISRKDSLNMALVLNLKGAIGNLDDEDINIKVDKGVVYIDISDKLLF